MSKYWIRKGDQEDIDEKTVNPFADMLVKSDRNYPKHRPLRVALFDLDGTLIDTEDQYSIFWGGMARRYRPDIPGLEQQIKGSTLERIYEMYFPDKELQKQITLELDEYERGMRYEFIPGALDFIKDIKKHGVRCAVVTSSNQPKIRAVLASIPELKTLFDRILTSEDFSASKPAPDCYLLGAKVFGVDIDECVVFEDAFNGLAAGMSSGIFTIGLATNNSPESIRDKCDYVINDFREMSYNKLIEVMNR